MKKHLHLLFFLMGIVFIGLKGLSPNNAFAQSSTISTTAAFSNNNGSGTVTFNFINNNSYPVVIKEIKGVTGSSGTLNASVWYKPTPINGAPGVISTANGWTQALSGTFTGVANTSTTTVQTFFSNVNFTIPANTTYGIAVFADGQRYFTMSASQSFTAGGCTLEASTTSAYGGGAPNGSAGTFNPRGWIGTITFEPAVVGINNAGVGDLITTSPTLCEGTYPFSVTVMNGGTNVINNVNLNWQVNGVLQTPIAITTPLQSAMSPGQSSVVVPLGNLNLSSTGLTLKYWTSAPNGGIDTVNGNDTNLVTLMPAMNGVYTVNSTQPASATNFQNFTTLATALNTRGVCGPVTINVATGTGPYTSQFLLDEIQGASAVNKIKINGNGNTLQFTPTGTANMNIVVLNGTKYVTFDNLKIKSNSATYGYGFTLLNGAQFDTIKNCTVDLSAVTTTTSTYACALAITSSLTSPTSYGANAQDIYIANNNFICGSPTAAGGAYYGIAINGASSTVGGSERITLVNNEISNFYYYGIRAYYGDGLVFKNNNVHKSTKTSITTSQYGMYLYYQQNLVVDGNRVHDFGVSTASYSSGILYPIYIYYPSGTAANPALIKNNAIYNIGTLGSTHYGLYIYSTSYANVMHNTITFDRDIVGTGTMYGLYLGGSGNNNKVINNIVSITKGTTGTKYGAYYSGTAFAGTNIHKNNIYVNSTQTGTQYWGYYSVARATLAAFQLAYPTMEIGSQSVDPQFVNPSAGDLTPGNPSLILSGNNVLSSVDKDILGQIRLSSPTVGAFERPITGHNNAGTTGLVSPIGNFCAGLQPVKASIMNFGTNILDSVQVNWSVNGVLQTPIMNHVVLNSSLNSTTFSTVVTLGNYNFTANQIDTLKIWTSLPNGGIDTINYNDTIWEYVTPTNYIATSSSNAACAGDPLIVTLSPEDGYNTGDITWQYSNNNGTTWLNYANSDSFRHIFTINNSTIVRAKLQGGSLICYSNELPLAFTNPAVLAVHDTFSCDPDSMLLRATGTAGTTLRWYDDPTSVTPVYVGDTFTTPYLNATTQYYVSAGAGPIQPGAQAVGTGTLTSSGGTYIPYYTGYASHKGQYLVKADELTALGYMNGYINAIGFKVNSTTTTTPLENFEIKMKLTNASAITTYETGLTTVYTNPAHTITASTLNYLMYQFTTPFYWDGVSNVIIDVCFENNSAPGGSTTIVYSSPGFSSSVYSYSNTAGNCTNPATIYSTTSRPRIQFEMKSSCESPKMPVEAKVVPAPQVNLPNDFSICLNNTETFDLTVNNVIPTFQYIWDDNSITMPRQIADSGMYILTVVDTYGCVGVDSVIVNVLEAPTTLLPDNAGLCNGSTLTLDAGAGYSYYYWNNGNTASTITVNQPGVYSVLVGAANGCERSDTVNVVIAGEMPSVDGIISNAVGGLVFNFSLYNPQNVVSYEWNFGDGNTSMVANPTHTYQQAGTYTVIVKASSVCGDTYDTALVHVLNSTDINSVNNTRDIKVYPNPSNGTFKIKLLNNIQINSYIVYNTLGQRVMEVISTNNHTSDEILVELATHLPTGIYQLYLNTNQGFYNQSIQLNR